MSSHWRPVNPCAHEQLKPFTMSVQVPEIRQNLWILKNLSAMVRNGNTKSHTISTRRWLTLVNISITIMATVSGVTSTIVVISQVCTAPWKWKCTHAWTIYINLRAGSPGRAGDWGGEGERRDPLSPPQSPARPHRPTESLLAAYLYIWIVILQIRW